MKVLGSAEGMRQEGRVIGMQEARLAVALDARLGRERGR